MTTTRTPQQFQLNSDRPVCLRLTDAWRVTALSLRSHFGFGLGLALSLASCLAPGLAQAAAEPLEDLEALLAQPVYAASKFAQDAADAPAAVTVLTAGDIRAFGWRTLAEVLNAVRGFSVREDRLYSYVGVRGFGPPGDYSSRVLVMIDGMRINDNIYDQAVAGREFPLAVDLIERVEVIAGPGSALYGSNAVLAVINVVTQTSAQLGGGSASVGVAAQGARFASVRQGVRLGEGSLVIAGRIEQRPGGDLYYPEYDSPAAANGLARGQDGERDRKLYVKWTQGEWTAALLASRREKTVPTGAFGVDFATPAINTDAYAMADLQWQHSLAQGQQVFAHGTLARYDFKTTSAYSGAEFVNLVDGRWAAGEVRWLNQAHAGHQFVLGLEAQKNLRQDQRAESLDAAGPAATQVRGSGQRWALFANDEWALNARWRLALGLRADRLLSGQSQLTPRVGVVWTPTPGMNWKLLQGRAFREPNAYESQYSDNVGTVANPALSTERLNATELALDWRVLPNLRMAASTFRYAVRGLISQQMLADSGALQYQNLGTVRASGAELEIDHVSEAGWRTRASWSAQTTRDAASSNQLNNSPRSLLKLHLTGPLPLPGWRLGAEAQRTGQRVSASGDVLPAQLLTNLSLQWRPAAAKWSLAGVFYNAFDQRFEDASGPEHVQRSLLRDGRRWALQGTVGF
jgi:outer membrane receptor for ferrienterochelin and colicin